MVVKPAPAMASMLGTWRNVNKVLVHCPIITYNKFSRQLLAVIICSSLEVVHDTTSAQRRGLQWQVVFRVPLWRFINC